MLVCNQRTETSGLLAASAGNATSVRAPHVVALPAATAVVNATVPPVTSVHVPLDPTLYCSLKSFGPVLDDPCIEETVIEVAPVVFTSACQYLVSAPLSHPFVETELGFAPVEPVGPPGQETVFPVNPCGVNV